MNKIAVIGAGSWGTTLACLLAEKRYDVSLWAYEKEIVDEINGSRVNSIYLSDVILPVNLKATNNIGDAVKQAHYILNVVPTQFTRSIFKEAEKYISKDGVIISASKGIEQGTLLMVSAILKDITGQKIAVLSGPSFAKEILKKLPTAVTLATENADFSLQLQEIFNTHYFRVYTHTDVLGVELGGALKNVIAIATGCSDGLGLGHNARAALITRGLAEIKRLGMAMGAHTPTFYGLSGIGDLVLTCTGELSRNRTLGFTLGQGMKLMGVFEGLSEKGVVAEGVRTAKAACEIAKR